MFTITLVTMDGNEKLFMNQKLIGLDSGAKETNMKRKQNFSSRMLRKTALARPRRTGDDDDDDTLNSVNFAFQLYLLLRVEWEGGNKLGNM
jgi:hypothetical protein